MHADVCVWIQEVLVLCVKFNEEGGFRDPFLVATSHEPQPKETLMLVTHHRRAVVHLHWRFHQARVYRGAAHDKPVLLFTVSIFQWKPDGDSPHLKGWK